VDEVLLSLKGRNLTAEQNVLALRYVVSHFTEGKIKNVASTDLADMFDKMMEETVAKAQNFNTQWPTALSVLPTSRSSISRRRHVALRGIEPL
jgi:hypothetical protein